MSKQARCHDASFARAHCRIAIRPEEEGLGASRHVATVSVIDPVSHELHPLVFRDGARISFPGESEALALNSTLTYLEGKFGAYSEPEFACLDDTESAQEGAPMTIEP